MPTWTLTTPPLYAPHAVATPAGWADPNTGELLVCITGLSTFKEPGGVPSIVDVYLNAATYKLGSVITATVEFSAPVVVTGTPQLTLTVNATNRSASYASGSGGHLLTFTYTVISSDVAAAGQLHVTSPLSLNSGTMKDVTSGNNIGLTFTNVDASVASVVVDGVVPTISSVTGITGHYVTGNVITATVNFNKSVNVTGNPTLPLNINVTARNAVYASGTGTNALVFTYTVVSGDVATAGQFTTGTTLALAGGTIKDAVTNSATLTFSAPTTSTVAVN